MRYTVREVLPDVLHFNFASSRIMVKSFLRFQEYWEHPVFRKRIFTILEYKEWYIRKHGVYDIEDAWAGCAMSEEAFIPFFRNKFTPSHLEKNILSNLRSRQRQKFFIITSVKKDTSTFTHELAHALYHTNASYRRQVRKILRETFGRNQRAFLNAELKRIGYAPFRFDDELHAYLIEGTTRFIELLGKRFRFKPHLRGQMKHASKLLKNNFAKHLACTMDRFDANPYLQHTSILRR